MIDNILCINLDDRADKWDQCNEHFQQKGLVGVQRFSASRPDKFVDQVNRGIIGCRESHIRCIQHAKQQQWDCVLILEDDAEFIASAEQISNALNLSRDCSWDILYLGANLERTTAIKRQDNGMLHLIDGALTTHCYVINQSAYDVVLDHYQAIRDLPVISLAQQELLAIDSIYKSLAVAGKIKTIHSENMLCIQRPGVSDIRGAHREYKLKEIFDNKVVGV